MFWTQIIHAFELNRYACVVVIVGVISSDIPAAKVKIGLHPSVLTLNVIPIRVKYDAKSTPDWKNEYSN